MRNLATIRKIKAVNNIDGYDKISLYNLENLGWNVIAGKDEFKIGELVVFIEPDTILPVRQEFEFLRKRCWNSIYEGFRIRVMKLAGIYSQGIIFPLSILPVKKGFFKKIYKEGQDITYLLNIIHYDEEEMAELKYRKNHKQKKYKGIKKLLYKLGLMGRKKKQARKRGNFPSFFPHTDETRVESILEILDYIKGKDIYITEKIDGCSASFFYKDDKFGVCSRNVKLVKEKEYKFIGDSHWFVTKKYNIEENLSLYCKENNKNLVLQGEVIGPKIQGNKYKLLEPDLYLYQAFDINKQTFLDFEDFMLLLEALKLKSVPILYMGNERDLNLNSINDWEKYSVGKSTVNTIIQREGIVVRTVKEETALRLKTVKQRLSFKVCNPEFDLKEESKKDKNEI